jgi:hypothetical protein
MSVVKFTQDIGISCVSTNFGDPLFKRDKRRCSLVARKVFQLILVIGETIILRGVVEIRELGSSFHS